MIKAKKILRLIRNKVKDNNEVQYSDYDVLDAMNECIRYLNMNYALKNSDFLERVKKYRQDEMGIVFSTDGAELPEDFVSLVSVIRARDGYHLSPVTAGEDMDKHKLQSIGGYKVFAGKIYCGTDFNLAYRTEIAQINDAETDEIDLPNAFIDIIVKVSCMILQNSADTDVMMGEISKLADSIVPARRYSNVKQRMPFIC